MEIEIYYNRITKKWKTQHIYTITTNGITNRL